MHTHGTRTPIAHTNITPPHKIHWQAVPLAAFKVPISSEFRIVFYIANFIHYRNDMPACLFLTYLLGN